MEEAAPSSSALSWATAGEPASLLRSRVDTCARGHVSVWAGAQ
jgi:hypothetical protein